MIIFSIVIFSIGGVTLVSAQGPQGDTGTTGPQGMKGDTGTTGPQGMKGDTGAQGPKGDTGSQGPQVMKGDTGAQDFEIVTVAENLEIPWEIEFSPDGRIFFTEREGALRVIEDGVLNPEPVTVLDVGTVEGGLLGLALDPNFEENHFLYLYYTYFEFPFTYNKVVRYTENNNSLSDELILVDKIPGSVVHDGGRIKFGPDEKLYITTGDAGNSDSAQDLNSLAGKILRINSDGTIPTDNPFSDSMVFSYGHRNPQGLDWDPITGKLVASEHGPTGERGFAHDEINVIEPGKNYGWPKVVGGEHDPEFVDPIIHTGDDTWAPSGATFYDSDNIPEWTDKFFVATLRGNHLRVLDLDIEKNQVISSEALFSDYGRLRDASMGPDGNLYLLTSNRDGRGNPAENDDRILKIVPIVSHDKILEDSLLSPLKQVKAGVLPNDVICREGLGLVFKYSNNSPACIKPQSVLKLIERGWILESSSIENFEDCVAAGNPVMESYPRQCRTIDGRHFVEEIN